MTGATAVRYAWWSASSDALATEMPTAGRRVVGGGISLSVGVPRLAPDVPHALNALRALSEDGAATFFLPARRGVDDPRRIEPVLQETEAAALREALGAARFVPGDYPFAAQRVVMRAFVLPILTGEKRPAEAARDAQPLVDAATLGTR